MGKDDENDDQVWGKSVT